MFCGKTEDLLKEPFLKEGFYGATDRHTAICISDKKINLPFQEKKGSPLISAVIPKTKGNPVTIDVLKLEDALMKECPQVDEMVGVMTKCVECNGHGETSCPVCCNLHECPVCEGIGKIFKGESTGKKISDFDMPVYFLGAYIKGTYLMRLVQASKLLGCKSILRLAGTERNGNYFKAGDFDFILMPINVDLNAQWVNLNYQGEKQLTK